MILLALAAAAAQPADTPRLFVTQTYARYRHDGFNPLAHPALYFTPTLAAAIAKDASGGEVGALDGDPLCDCQDYGRLSARIVSLSQPDPRSASARVRVTLGPRDSRNLRLSLVRTTAGWRVGDVVDPYGRSLLAALQRSNADRAPHRR